MGLWGLVKAAFKARRVARTRGEYYADYDAEHEDGHHIVACGHGVDERVDAAVEAQAILLQLQHHGDNDVRGDGGDDQAVTLTLHKGL